MENLSLPFQWFLYGGWALGGVIFSLIILILRHTLSEFKAFDARVSVLEASAGAASGRFEERTTVQNSFARVHERLDNFTKDVNQRIDTQTATITAQINQMQTNLLNSVAIAANRHE